MEDYLTEFFKDKEQYQFLLEKKQRGEALSFNEISCYELAELFFVEQLPDYCIAELYNVEKKAVVYKRRKWGIKQAMNKSMIDEMVQRGFMTEVEGVLLFSKWSVIKAELLKQYLPTDFFSSGKTEQEMIQQAIDIVSKIATIKKQIAEEV